MQNQNIISQIKNNLRLKIDIKSNNIKFFKTAQGEYSEHDKFLGISVPILKVVAKQYKNLSLPGIQLLLKSKFNEERLLALIILVNQYQKADESNRAALYNFYLKNIEFVNNWNLVDASAHYIVGAYLFHYGNCKPLVELAQSNNLWKKRIAIVATWYFMKQKDTEATVTISTILLQDKHDLIHKAVGWMLRELGKINSESLMQFLNQHAVIMPRTMLRYSIEKLSIVEKQKFMNMKGNSNKKR